jgi:peptidoglycan/LPS O-acetylase OafA/YrhL
VLVSARVVAYAYVDDVPYKKWGALYAGDTIGTIAVLVLPLSLIAAVVMNAVIEQPAIRLSRVLSSWWTRSPWQCHPSTQSASPLRAREVC